MGCGGGFIRRLATAVKPGGVVAIEDTDFAGHFCHPACAAFERYVAWYQEAVRRKGGDAHIGRRLPELLTAAGIEVLGLDVILPTYQRGTGKRLAAVTLAHIRESLTGLGLATGQEVDTTLQELHAFTADESSTCRESSRCGAGALEP